MKFPPSDYGNTKPKEKRKRKPRRRYTHLRQEYLNKHPICEICKLKPSLVIHHLKTRKLHLNDISVFQAACLECERRQHEVEKESNE